MEPVGYTGCNQRKDLQSVAYINGTRSPSSWETNRKRTTHLYLNLLGSVSRNGKHLSTHIFHFGIYWNTRVFIIRRWLLWGWKGTRVKVDNVGQKIFHLITFKLSKLPPQIKILAVLCKRLISSMIGTSWHFRVTLIFTFHSFLGSENNLIEAHFSLFVFIIKVTFEVHIQILG